MSSIIISMILGFGLATIFRKSCSLRGCYVFKGPQLSKIEGKTFEMNNKCYEYEYQHQTCKNSNAKIIDFSDRKKHIV